MTRILLLALLGLVVATPAAAQCVQGFPDPFTASDGTNLEAYNADCWDVTFGAASVFAIWSNRVSSINTGAYGLARWLGGTFADNHYAQIVFDQNSGGSSSGPACRVATDNGYVVFSDFSIQVLLKIVGGTATELANSGVDNPIPDGTTVRLTCDGTSIQSTLNGVSSLGTTDAALSSGRPGLGGLENGALNGVDDFSAASIGGSGISRLPLLGVGR